MTWLKNLQTALEPYPWAYTLLVVLVLAGITLLVNFITKFILYRGLRKYLRNQNRICRELPYQHR